jgi:hypothetical protein
VDFALQLPVLLLSAFGQVCMHSWGWGHDANQAALAVVSACPAAW